MANLSFDAGTNEPVAAVKPTHWGGGTMKPRFSKVIIVLPEITTGGPEAMHQLAYCINSQGGYARMLYTNSQCRLTGADAVGGLSPDSTVHKTYREYDPQPVAMETLTADTLVVFPEIMIDDCYSFSQNTKAQCACWWLSVDNAQRAGSGFGNHSARSRFFSSVFQFAQSEYAISFLRAAGAYSIYKISDYTGREFVDRSNAERSDGWPIKRVPRSVAYFPHKGAKLAAAFQQKTKEMGLPLVLRPIANMTREQIVDLLLSSEIYIDFGHNPGKDRIPREAPALGCVVLLNRVGAATLFADHPLSDAYKFLHSDIMSGDLARLVDGIFGDTRHHVLAQSYYRNIVLTEKTEFDRLVSCFFFQ